MTSTDGSITEYVCVYGTVETSKNKEKKSDKDGSTRILCEHGIKLPKRALVLCESDNS